MYNIEEIILIIEETRNKLNNLLISITYDECEVLKISQELDRLIMDFYYAKEIEEGNYIPSC